MGKIEVCYLKPSELKNTFGNPRKISKAKMDDLKKSIEKLDDFGVIVIDEGNQIISGNQRVEAMKQMGIETPIACKKLVGYSDEEKKVINLKANTTSGEWDFSLIGDWIKDINLDIDFDIDLQPEQDIKTKEIKLTPYKNIYVFLTIPLDKIIKVSSILKELQAIEGIEYDQSQN